jgi:hypothetical protein
MSLTSVGAALLPWLSATAVVVLGAIAIIGAIRVPMTTVGGKLRLVGTIAAAAVAVAGTLWQARQIGAMAMVSGTPVPSETADKLKSLETQLAMLQHRTTIRAIGSDAALKFTHYLKNFSKHRVVVSCIPHDVEAYDYATQLVNILRAADWDARGPELTTIFGDIRAMGVNIYDDAPPGSDTAKILMTGFAKFNIPFQTRVAGNGTAVDAVVELFIGTQPSQRAAMRADRGAR